MSFFKTGSINGTLAYGIVCCLMALVVMACYPEDEMQKRFTLLGEDKTSIGFSNTITATDSLNILNYIYFYNGGGVGIGDINNDGLEDVFFAGNQAKSRLYLNQGDLKFKDITTAAGLMTDRWCTGVSLVDINTDGYLDIYISVAGSPYSEQRANLLFINHGNQTFTEQARSYGIADTAYTTQSAFFDYDRDGDLDLYLLNHANERESLNTPLPRKVDGEAANTDKLYRNNGDGTFSDVSVEAGIVFEGYGLGVSISDIDLDGWQDLYISNDFISNDLLYLNNRDGTFNNVIADAISEQTYNGMGNDVADFNNDGLPDIVALDMLPPDPVREKTMAGSMTYDKYQVILEMGYEPQFMRNTLQLNQGNMRFAEIGRFAGIHRTDWSWAPLLADFDNDGRKDLFITNGYLRDITDKDFIDYNNNLSMFKSGEEAQKETLKRIQELRSVKLPNYLFRNEGDLTFSDQTIPWGMDIPSLSNGAAYGDLDNDGDLDLVVNNINAPAFVFRNNTDAEQNYLQVVLKGPENNPRGLGTKVRIVAGTEQTLERSPFRGFMSSVSGILHFGLGKQDTVVQSLQVTWPDGKYREIAAIPTNQRLEISYKAAQEVCAWEPKPDHSRFHELADNLGIDYVHQPAKYPHFKSDPLLPYRLSGKGPVLTTGDLDGNRLEDLVVGGGAGQPSVVFFQEEGGRFRKMEIPGTEDCEVMDALVFDANGDLGADLYLACGGVAFAQGSENYRDRLFFGGPAGLTQEQWLPEGISSTGCVSACDFDGDGDLDLFVGGYAEPRNYPALPGSYLLKNQGNGFEDVTKQVAPGLVRAGMIRDAIWADYNNDDRDDLIIVGEWMPVMVFANLGGVLEDRTEAMGLAEQTGWWQSVVAEDIDHDGHIDLLCGNMGLNAGYDVSAREPIRLYAPDLNKDGKLEPIMTYFVDGKETMQVSRENLLGRQPFLSRKFPDHLSFARASIRDILPDESLANTPVLESKTLASLFFRNNGNGTFRVNTLPDEAQLFPLRVILPYDHNQDPYSDFLLGGGFSEAEFDGRSYGTTGTALLVAGSGAIFSIEPGSSLFFNHDVTSMVSLSVGGKRRILIVGVRQGRLRVFEF